MFGPSGWLGLGRKRDWGFIGVFITQGVTLGGYVSPRWGDFSLLFFLLAHNVELSYPESFRGLLERLVLMRFIASPENIGQPDHF